MRDASRLIAFLVVAAIVVPIHAADSAAPRTSASPAASPTPGLIAAATPGTIYGKDEPICGSFIVAATSRPVLDVIVSATGLDASLSGTRGADGCPSHGAPIERIGRVCAAGARIFYRIGATSFPQSGDTTAGMVHITSAGTASVDVPLALRRAVDPRSAWLSAVVVPPVVAAVIGVFSALIGLRIYRAQRMTDQNLTERTQLQAFLTTDAEALDRFFRGVYRQIAITYAGDMTDAGARNWRTNVLKRLHEEHIIDHIPWADRTVLVRELSIDSDVPPENIANRLSRIFVPCAARIKPLDKVALLPVD
jgi:hypothetical protein